MQQNLSEILSRFKSNSVLNNTIPEEIVQVMLEGQFFEETKEIDPETEIEVGVLNLFEKALHTLVHRYEEAFKVGTAQLDFLKSIKAMSGLDEIKLFEAEVDKFEGRYDSYFQLFRTSLSERLASIIKYHHLFIDIRVGHKVILVDGSALSALEYLQKYV